MILFLKNSENKIELTTTFFLLTVDQLPRTPGSRNLQLSPTHDEEEKNEQPQELSSEKEKFLPHVP